jgi:hypothetical protein
MSLACNALFAVRARTASLPACYSAQTNKLGKAQLWAWLTAAGKRLHHNILATALANKLTRIAWTVLVQGRNYEARDIGRGVRSGP